MNGPTVVGAVLAISAAIVLMHLVWEHDREERERRRDLDGVDEWERVKRDLGPRSLP